MNRKLNTLLFIAGATVLNIVLTGGFFLIFFLLYVRLLAPRLPEGGGVWGFPVVFVLALVLAFFVYRLLIKIVFSRVRAEKYFDPVFKSKPHVR
jgi:hypothetical protein